MKRLLLTLLTLLGIFQLHAQINNGFNFQGVARNADNAVISRKKIAVRVAILDTIQKQETEVYAERHEVSTDNFGLFSLTIGDGKPEKGDFSVINWAAKTVYKLGTSIDPDGGSKYTLTGTYYLRSVPYAKYAEKAGNVYWQEAPGGGIAYWGNINIGGLDSRIPLVVRTEAPTQGIFGNIAGVSLQTNWPGIGFNHYYANGQRSLSKGYGGYIGVDPINGGMFFRTIPFAKESSVEVTLEDRMYISPSGLVGIGTIAPTATFDVARGSGNDGTAIFRGTEAVSHFNYSSAENTYIRGGKSGSKVYINDGNTGGVSLVKDGGSVSIGKDTTDGRLTINNINLAMESTALSILTYSTRDIIWGVSPYPGLKVENFGTGRAASFRSKGDGIEIIAGTSSLPQIEYLALRADGNVIINGNIKYSGTFSQLSDLRFKEKVQPLQSSLSKVLNLNGVNYYYKTSQFPEKRFSSNLQIGFIAQEVKKIVPELVVEAKDGYLSVDYAKVTPLLVEAMKEQNAVIEKQSAVIEKQNALIENHDAKIEKLNGELEALRTLNNALVGDINAIKAQVQEIVTENKTSLK